MAKNVTRIHVPGENETLWEKTKRAAHTAVNWGKTHWKELTFGAIAIGGGAYMLSRRGKGDNDEATECSRPLMDGETVREAIGRAFDDQGDGSDIGPDDDEPEVDEY